MSPRRRVALILSPFVLLGMFLAIASAFNRSEPAAEDFATPITSVTLTEDDLAFWTSTLEVLGQAVEQSRLLPKVRTIESLTAEMRSTKTLRMTLLNIGEPNGIDMSRFFLVHQEIGRSLKLARMLEQGAEDPAARRLLDSHMNMLATIDRDEANGISAPPGTRERIEQAIPRLEHALANPFHGTLKPGGRDSLNAEFVISRADAVEASWQAFADRVEAATVVVEKPSKPEEPQPGEKPGGSE